MCMYIVYTAAVPNLFNYVDHQFCKKKNLRGPLIAHLYYLYFVFIIFNIIWFSDQYHATLSLWVLEPLVYRNTNKYFINKIILSNIFVASFLT